MGGARSAGQHRSQGGCRRAGEPMPASRGWGEPPGPLSTVLPLAGLLAPGSLLGARVTPGPPWEVGLP